MSCWQRGDHILYKYIHICHHHHHHRVPQSALCDVDARIDWHSAAVCAACLSLAVRADPPHSPCRPSVTTCGLAQLVSTRSCIGWG